VIDVNSALSDVCENIDLSECVYGGTDGVPDVFLLRDIAPDGYGSPALRLDLANDLLESVNPARAADHRRTLLCEPDGAGASDARTRAGHDGDSSF
jgi:hypothetical protein